MRLLKRSLRLRMGLNSAHCEQDAADLSEFSLPWWVRFTRWRPTSLREAQIGERKLLALCSTHMELRNVKVGAQKEDFMHTITGGTEKGPPLVSIPGYGAGAGFYFRNIDGLAKHFRLHLVDLLGTGMSGRPRFVAKTREEAENFFVDSLAKWREEMKIDKMVLMGHSLGGYLAATYALKHPEHVEHLILVCPAGMSKPADVSALPASASPWSWRGQSFRLGRTLWESGVTPGSIIRVLGPWGPGLIRGYARNRFKEGMHLREDEVSAFEEYFYHISAAKGSGEFALSHLLAPFARARHPLEGRLHQLQVPCSLIYGERDWTDPNAGQRIFNSVFSERGRLGDSDLQVDVIPNAGHYPFLDQPNLFLQRVVKQSMAIISGYGKEALQSAQETLRQTERASSDSAEVGERQFDL